MELEQIKCNLKWNKEQKDLNTLIEIGKQKKENNEVREMLVKNKDKQRNEN